MNHNPIPVFIDFRHGTLFAIVSNFGRCDLAVLGIVLSPFFPFLYQNTSSPSILLSFRCASLNFCPFSCHLVVSPFSLPSLKFASRDFCPFSCQVLNVPFKLESISNQSSSGTSLPLTLPSIYPISHLGVPFSCHCLTRTT